MDREEVEGLVLGLCSGDRDIQRYIADTYFSEDIVFRHILGSTSGRENVYRLYRLASTVFRYKVTFYEYMKSGNSAMLKTDLGIRVAPFFLLRYHFPCITLLEFRPDPADPKAPLKLCRQEDHHSMYAALWLLGWPWSYMADITIQRFQGIVGTWLGAAIDFLDDVATDLPPALGWAPPPRSGGVLHAANGLLQERGHSLLSSGDLGPRAVQGSTA